MMRKIVISGGVLTPAVSLIEELQREKNWDIYYFGRKSATEGSSALSSEAKIIPSFGVHYIFFNPGRLQRQFSRYTLWSLVRVPLGFLQAFVNLLKIKPAIIVSFGGYVSVPVVLAGWFLRIPILTHEQTVIFGLSSKINAFFSSKIAVSFEQSLKHFPKKKTVLTGNPLRRQIFLKKKPNWFVGEIKKPLVYVTGGNQGALVINESVWKILPAILEDFVVIHQTGEAHLELGILRKNELTPDKQKNYFVRSFIGNDEIGWVLNQADLVVSRSGANTICELAVLGKPSILIPIPWTYQNEQFLNAQMLKEAGIAEIINQTDLTPNLLLEKIKETYRKKEDLFENRSKAEKLIIKNAVENLLGVIHELAG